MNQKLYSRLSWTAFFLSAGRFLLGILIACICAVGKDFSWLDMLGLVFPELLMLPMMIFYFCYTRQQSKTKSQVTVSFVIMGIIWLMTEIVSKVLSQFWFPYVANTAGLEHYSEVALVSGYKNLLDLIPFSAAAIVLFCCMQSIQLQEIVPRTEAQSQKLYHDLLWTAFWLIIGNIAQNLLKIPLTPVMLRIFNPRTSFQMTGSAVLLSTFPVIFVVPFLVLYLYAIKHPCQNSRQSKIMLMTGCGIWIARNLLSPLIHRLLWLFTTAEEIGRASMINSVGNWTNTLPLFLTGLILFCCTECMQFHDLKNNKKENFS